MYDRRTSRRQTAPVFPSNAVIPLRVQSAYQKLEAPTSVSLLSPPFSQISDILLSAFSQSDIFFSLPAAEVERFYPRLVYLEVKANQLVFEEGFPGTAYYILHTGEVRLLSNQKYTNVVTPGMCFGSLCLKFGCGRFFSAYSNVLSRIWAIKLEDFRAIELVARANFLLSLDSAIEDHSCLRVLSQRKRKVFIDNCAVHKYKAGVTILTEGALGNLIFFILSGCVEVSKDGVKLRTLGPDEFFGEQSALYANLCTATVTTATEILCLSLDKSHLQIIFGLSLSQFIFRNTLRIAFDQSCYLSQLSSEQKEALLKCVRIVTYAYDEVVISENTSFGEGLWVVLQGSLIARHKVRMEDGNQAEVYDCINDDIIGERHADGFFTHDVVANMDEVAVGEARLCDIEQCLGAGFQLCLSPGHIQREMLRDFYFLANFSPRKQAVFMRLAEVVSFPQGNTVPSEVHTLALCLLQQGEVAVDGTSKVFRAPTHFGYGSSNRTLADIRLSACCDCVCITLNKRHFKTVFGFYSHEFIQKMLDSRPRSSLYLSDLTIVHRYEKLKTGSIFLATDSEGKQYGLKRVCRQKVKSLFLGAKLQAEREILSLLSHPLIPRLVCTFRDSHYLYFLKEFIPGLILADLLPQVTGLKENEVKEYVAMILSILEHLHSFDIVHRDVNPESFLVDSSGYLRLIDIGSATILHERSYSITGSPQYIAPEILNADGGGKPADLWSLGVMIFELIYGRVPYGDSEEDPYLVFREITEGPEVQVRDARLTTECCNFVNRLLTRDEHIRGTVATAKCDPWLHDFEWVMCRQDSITEQRASPGLCRLMQEMNLDVQQSNRMRRRWPFTGSGSASPFRQEEKLAPLSDEWMDGF